MPSHRELILGTSLPVVEAFLAGLTRGTAAPYHPCFNECSGVRSEGPVEHLLEKLHLETDATHLILPSREAECLVRALAMPGEGASRIPVRANREIREASFGYRFRVYARPEADAIRQALAALPEGVVAEETENREEENPEAKGAELYAPLHAYVLSGRGKMRGPFAPILAVHQTLTAHPMVETEDIVLAFVAADPPRRGRGTHRA
jgi:hypothetical protein